MKAFKAGRKSITTHWLINGVGVIIAVLIIIEILLIVSIRSYYYSSVRQYLSSKMNVITGSILNEKEQSVNYNSEIRSLVAGYADKDKIELMAIDQKGEVDITSSGFKPVEKTFADYESAKASSTGSGYEVYRTSTGEKVLAFTTVFSVKGCEYEALRMIVSLSEIDRKVLSFAVIITLIGVLIILIVFFSGMFFIKGIVHPVIEIGDVARQYAKGDFSKRLEKQTNDELGELCDSINYMADELSNTEQMKNEFISSVSHELRTPLTAIKGWSETMMSIDDRETFIKGMRVITSETERLSQMVEELLDFSRIQDGRLYLQKAKMDILAELGETVLIYQQRAKALGITLNYYEPEMLPFIYGDRNRLRQVFINIVDNAIKYSDKGDTVSVEAYQQGDMIVICVSDTGIGISKEDLPKVKQKFFKSNQTRRGSGIGLAVADEIVRMHGGSLDIRSEENVGTTVIMELPFIDEGKSSGADNEKVNVEIISTENSGEL
ncbi:HAMP domain-containing sensor histidine kinase [Ruminococcus sp. NK3A76]|uniref:sensor histidine kinase n=1 Tax=Ruminococcus sp. NK3A76 TaxID=877411 RepID=UPI00048AA661|nr:HAMP domain-containing sensor histidine kinase [Ruminococcus sp. NK3A76]